MSQDHTRLPPTRGEGQGLTADGLPKIFSIWRENDNRFERHVEVVGYEGFAGSLPHKMVLIRTVAADDGRALTNRVTKARLDAFGKRYRLASAAGQSLTEASVYGSSPLINEAHPPGGNSHEG